MCYSLPVSLLRQHCFCPRIPYFQELLKLKLSAPQWVKQGEALHRKQPSVFKHRMLKRFGLERAEQHFEVFVQSDSLRLHGIVDCVLMDAAAVYPVEIKLSGHKPTKGQIAQLIAYAMVAREQFKLVCNNGFILLGAKGKAYPIIVDAVAERKVLEIRDEIFMNLEKSYLPDSSATFAQCTQCEYLNHCNDRN